MDKSENEETARKASRKCFNVNFMWMVSAAVLLWLGTLIGRWDTGNFRDIVNEAKKPESIEALGSTRINGECVVGFLYPRIAIVTTGADEPEIEYSGFIAHRVDAKESSIGLATAISEDGYFLSAAHCVFKDDSASPPPNIWISGLTAKDPYRVLARVVWFSDEQDLVLLQTSLEPSRWFTVEESVPEVGLPVIAGGLSGGPSGGKLLGRNQISSENVSHVRLLHSAPAIPGDSGGPLFTLDGSLIGINLSGKKGVISPLLGNSKTNATLVNHDRLSRLIEEDRVKFNTSKI